ncbi:MAG TPA: M90 family metallopeptidase [Bacteroidota bacterium]|nr:M90 family metallopeptidase [Bacteroidota bacterium]
MIDYHAHYRAVIARQRKWSLLVSGILLLVFGAATLAKDAPVLAAFGCMIIVAAAALIYEMKTRRYTVRLRLLDSEFPPEWRLYLADRSVYFSGLSKDERRVFEQRVLFFLAEVRIDGVDTEADDKIKLLVAASAIIPTFAFPYFEYPNLRTVLVYPDTFNERFETDAPDPDENHSSGMVGTGYMNYTVLLSRRDLMAAFSGVKNRKNVGIHEFVHLLDKADGSIDGVPEILMDRGSAPAWLELIAKEMKEIERGRSDFDEYALTDEAEFFAVACEYYFNNPDRFRENHAALYDAFCAVFRQSPARGE